MQVPYAARFATVAFLVAALYTRWQLPPGLYMIDILSARQSWVLNHVGPWNLGGWLWLLALFSWMVLLTALTWSYLPAHRMAGSLQSGLMIIAAVLIIASVGVWMNVLPTALVQTEQVISLTPLINALALSFLGSGCFMGGTTTAWIAWNLMQQQVLPRPWLLLALLSGLCILLAPFFQFNTYLLVTSLLCWLACCLWLSIQRRLPSPFSVWPET